MPLWELWFPLSYISEAWYTPENIWLQPWVRCTESTWYNNLSVFRENGEEKKRRAWNSDPCCVRHLRLGRIVFVFKLYIHWTGIKKIDSKEEGKMRNETDRREGEPEHRLVSCFYAWFHGLCESISRCTWLMLLWWSACVLSVPLFF